MSDMIAWATTDSRLGGDPGITVTYYSGDGVTGEHDLSISDLDREMLADEYGRLPESLADRLLTANGYERDEPWRDSGGQWGARVSRRPEPDDITCASADED